MPAHTSLKTTRCVTNNNVVEYHNAFEVWNNDGIAVFVPKETILKETAAKIE
jgi:hypothetical protein